MHQILLLEYNPLIAELFQQLLPGRGYEVLATSSPKEAMRLLRKRNIDLLILAHGPSEITKFHGLPLSLDLLEAESPETRLTGQEFLRLVKDDENLRHIAVMLFTGYPREVSGMLLQTCGLDINCDVCGFVQKGEDCVKSFVETVETILRQHGSDSSAPCSSKELHHTRFAHSDLVQDGTNVTG